MKLHCEAWHNSVMYAMTTTFLESKKIAKWMIHYNHHHPLILYSPRLGYELHLFNRANTPFLEFHESNAFQVKSTSADLFPGGNVTHASHNTCICRQIVNSGKRLLTISKHKVSLRQPLLFFLRNFFPPRSGKHTVKVARINNIFSSFNLCVCDPARSVVLASWQTLRR